MQQAASIMRMTGLALDLLCAPPALSSGEDVRAVLLHSTAMRWCPRHGVGAAQRSRRDADAAVARFQLMSLDMSGVPGKCPQGVAWNVSHSGHGLGLDPTSWTAKNPTNWEVELPPCRIRRSSEGSLSLAAWPN